MCVSCVKLSGGSGAQHSGQCCKTASPCENRTRQQRHKEQAQLQHRVGTNKRIRKMPYSAQHVLRCVVLCCAVMSLQRVENCGTLFQPRTNNNTKKRPRCNIDSASANLSEQRHCYTEYRDGGGGGAHTMGVSLSAKDRWPAHRVQIPDANRVIEHDGVGSQHHCRGHKSCRNVQCCHVVPQGFKLLCTSGFGHGVTLCITKHRLASQRCEQSVSSTVS